MARNIPLEDGFTDIIGKAQRGQSITDEALAGLTGISLPAIQSLKAGDLDANTLTKVAGALGLGANALLALAKEATNPPRSPFRRDSPASTRTSRT